MLDISLFGNLNELIYSIPALNTMKILSNKIVSLRDKISYH